MQIPGFVDLQVNGFKGVDFSGPDLTEESFARACRALLEEATTAFLPTVVTSSIDTYSHNLPLMARIMEWQEFKGRLLGFHIEGPFISPEPGARGAHNPDYIRQPDLELFRQIYDWADGKVKVLTIAADVPGADELARMATDMGVAVSLGHQMATESDLQRLIKAGARALTHLGNGIPNMLPRHHNPIWAGLAADELSALIITDGHHLPPAVIKTFLRAKTPARIIVISDIAPLAGLPPGRYEWMGAKVVLEESGLLHDPVKQCLAGSSATMLQCMNYLASLNLLSPEELLQVGFYNPLQLIGVKPNQINPLRQLAFDPKELTFRFV